METALLKLVLDIVALHQARVCIANKASLQYPLTKLFLVGGGTAGVGCTAVSAASPTDAITDTPAPDPCTTPTTCCFNLYTGSMLVAADQATLHAGPNTEVGGTCQDVRHPNSFLFASSSTLR